MNISDQLMVRWRLAAIVCIVSGFTSPVAQSQDVRPPTDPVARAAFDTLEKSCSRCHQVGRLVERERPARGFGNVLYRPD